MSTKINVPVEVPEGKYCDGCLKLRKNGKLLECQIFGKRIKCLHFQIYTFVFYNEKCPECLRACEEAKKQENSKKEHTHKETILRGVCACADITANYTDTHECIKCGNKIENRPDWMNVAPLWMKYGTDRVCATCFKKDTEEAKNLKESNSTSLKEDGNE